MPETIKQLEEDLESVEADLEYAEDEEKEALEKKKEQIEGALKTLKKPERKGYERVLEEASEITSDPEMVRAMSSEEHQAFDEAVQQARKEKAQALAEKEKQTKIKILDEIKTERNIDREIEELSEKDHKEFVKQYEREIKKS